MITRRGLALLLVAPVVLSGLVLSRTPPAAGANATLAAAADGYVDSSSPTTAYGALGKLRVDSDPETRSYLHFDLSTVTEAVTRAVLVLTPTSSLAAGLDVRGVQHGAQWSEGSLTFATAPAVGAVAATTGALSAGAPVSVDVTALVDGAVLDVALTARSSVALALGSRESTTPPALQLDTVADPAPHNQVLPALSGTPQAGKSLVADMGSWVGAVPMAYSYSWQRCDTSGGGCVPVAGASDSGYPLTSTDVGRRVRAQVTATNASGASSALSEPSEVVVAKPPPSRDQVVLAAGDIACGVLSRGASCRQQDTADLLVAQHPDAVIPLGDTQYECGDASDFQGSYDPSWGRVLSVTRPVPGNHEYTTTTNTTNNCYDRPVGAPGYYGYFGDAASPTEPGCRVSCRGYYSYDLGDWHLIALNSNCGRGVACADTGPQATWLRADLQAHSGQCTLAAFHHPRWTSGQELNTPAVGPLVQLLYDAGADVILNGHDHDYERFAPLDPLGQVDPVRGYREFVVGTGGRNLTSFSSVANGSEVRDASTFGVLKLVLSTESYSWEFLPVAGSGGFRDSDSQPCHSSSLVDRTPPSAPSGLVASAVGPRVDLDWDGVPGQGVVAHRVYRDGALLATTGSTTGYGDSTAGFGGTHGYAVVAVDAAGNASPVSATVSASTRGGTAGTSLLEDGFESGTLDAWTSVNGMTVQRDLVSSGRWAARSVAGAAGASYASGLFPETGELWARWRVQVVSQGSTLALLRLRNSANASLLTVQLSSSGLLQYVDEPHALTRSSAVRPPPGSWHTVDLHVQIGSAGLVELALDGSPVLTGTEDLGGLGVVRAYLGETNSSHTGEQALDDVYVGSVPPPTGSASLTPTSGVDTTSVPRELTASDLDAVREAEGTTYLTAGTWGGTGPGTSDDVAAVTCGDALTCWLVAKKGLVARTLDGGRTWQVLPSGTTQDLLGVAFVDRSRGAVVGKRGVLLVTGDGGSTWSTRSTGTSKDLLAVAWADAQQVVTVGASGTLLTSGDSGGSWQSRSSGTSQDLRAVSALDSSRWVAVGKSGAVIRTVTAGTTWTASKPTGKDLSGVAVRAGRTIAVGQSGTVLISLDGGAQWTSATAPSTDLSGVAAAAGTRWWATGRRGSALTSTDDGRTWRDAASGVTKDLTGVAAVTGRTVVVGQSGTVRLTDNDGLTWSAQPAAALTWRFTTPRVNPSSVRLALGYRTATAAPTGTTAALWTTVDGSTWTSHPLPVPTTGGTSTVLDLTDQVGGDPDRLANLQVRFVVLTPTGSSLRTQHDLVRLDVSA